MLESTDLAPSTRAAAQPPATSRGTGPSTLTTQHVLIAAAIIAAHVALAFAFRRAAALATVHALATVVGGMVYIATTKRTHNVAVVMSYVAGCEVLWRMTKAGVFWEFGKYAMIAVALVALARIRTNRNRGLAIAYFAFLIPSMVLTFTSVSVSTAREQISFVLSGPLAIAVAILVFSSIRVSTQTLRAIVVALVSPVAGIAALSYSSTTRSDLVFENASNLATSGGFSGNQVSSMLGIAALFLLLMSLQRLLSWRVRGGILLLTLALLTQSALTFSRGGVLLAFAGFAAAMFVLMRSSGKARASVILIGLSVAGVGKYIVEPRLDDFTGGKLRERYADTSSSGRDQFASAELAVFVANPILGVGPGLGNKTRAELGLITGASHTEYTRALAEHGFLGLFSVMCLLALTVRAVARAPNIGTRAFASAMVTWATLFLLLHGTRIAAPALVLGLAFVRPPSVRPPSSPADGPR